MHDESDPVDEERTSEGFVSRTIPPSSDTSEYDFLEIVAELEDKELDELPRLYDEVGHFIETLFENPPSPESQFEMKFSYAGYRITINHQGDITLLPVKNTVGK